LLEFKKIQTLPLNNQEPPKEGSHPDTCKMVDIGKKEPVTASAEKLKRFSPLNEAPPHKLQEIADKAQWLRAGKKEVLMELGDTDESSIFLLKGNILLEAADGRKRIIKHTDPAAGSPLSRLRPSRYRVTALTPVQYVKIENHLLDQLLEEEEASELVSSHYYVVEDGNGGDQEADFSTQVLAQIYEDLHRNSLQVLSWQPASLIITERMLREEDHKKLARYAMLDPVLMLKLLRKAGQGSGGGIPERPAAAIHAVGTEETHRLAFLNLFRESCKPRTQVMKEIYSNTWEQSIAVSRLAGELAREHGLKPVDTVAMAGLLHNIGKITLIGYAYNFYREVALEELKECIRMFSKETGRMVLSHWNLPASLVRGITDSFDWSMDHGGQRITLGDVLIAARLYTRLARKHRDLQDVPALRRLGLQDPRSSRGQALQNLVIQAVAEARELLRLQRRRTSPPDPPVLLEQVEEGV